MNIDKRSWVAGLLYAYACHCVLPDSRDSQVYLDYSSYLESNIRHFPGFVAEPLHEVCDWYKDSCYFPRVLTLLLQIISALNY